MANLDVLKIMYTIGTLEGEYKFSEVHSFDELYHIALDIDLKWQLETDTQKTDIISYTKEILPSCFMTTRDILITEYGFEPSVVNDMTEDTITIFKQIINAIPSEEFKDGISFLDMADLLERVGNMHNATIYVNKNYNYIVKFS